MTFNLDISPEFLKEMVRFNDSVDFIRNQQPPKRWYNEEEARHYLGEVSLYTLQKWRKDGRIRAVAIGEVYRYDVKDLDAFMELHKLTPFAEPALQSKKTSKLKVA